MVPDDLGDVLHRLVDFQNRGADLAVAAHLGHLGFGELSGLEEYRVRDADLPDIVQIPADPDRHLFALVQAKDRGHSLG